MTPDAFQELIRTLGLPIAITVAILVSGARGWWVFGWSYDELKEDRDAWRRQAENGTDLAHTAVTQGAARRRP